MSGGYPARRLYAVGQCAVPESTPAGAPSPHRRYPLLSATWQLAGREGRLAYTPNVTAYNAGTNDASPRPAADAGTKNARRDMPFAGPPGICRGLYAAKYVVCGTAIEAMDPAVVHVESLDVCFQSARGQPCAHYVVKVVGSGPVSLALLNIGVAITLSTNPDWHGNAIAVPSDPATGAPPSGTIRDIAAGESHYVFCDTKGRVYSWGWANDYGQLGRGTVWPADSSRIGVHDPKPLIGFGGHESASLLTRENDRAAVDSPNVAAVACGRHHTLLLTERRNCVYVFGRGHRGQLGLGRRGADSTLRVVEVAPSPRSAPLVFGVDIDCIRASGDTSLLLLRNGHMIVFGDNACGQCGTGTTKAVTAPQVVSIFDENDEPLDGANNATNPPASRGSKRSPRYGTVESFLHPRRVPTLTAEIEAVEQSKAHVLKVCDVSMSDTHTVASTTDGHMLSSGLRPLRTLGESDPVGVLGRMLHTDDDALHFGQMAGLHYEAGDRVAVGPGFVALFNRRRNDIHLVGRVSGPQGVIASSSLPPSSAVDRVLSLAPPAVCPAVLNLGIDKRVVDVFPSGKGGGLLLLVDCYPASR